MADTCKTCLHFTPAGAPAAPAAGLDDPVPGFCQWVPPPMLTRLHSMAQSEPSNEIAYEQVMRQAPQTHSDNACSCWTPADHRIARLRRLMRN
ncbi:hypothetical protein BA190_26825 [Labrys sp. WJW]|uniref:hypothetical protein n=1 Tax=Labrys sp. WJW TaxID=1737983 RepID=UPI00082C8CD9|nr:hypothetical protein [Labrys sp. WJW]OCC01829.1 hypothetical protein BA190_26825 [Labrys sp. WJW]